jgi:hypothetical protein
MKEPFKVVATNARLAHDSLECARRKVASMEWDDDASGLNVVAEYDV